MESEGERCVARVRCVIIVSTHFDFVFLDCVDAMHVVSFCHLNSFFDAMFPAVVRRFGCEPQLPTRHVFSKYHFCCVSMCLLAIVTFAVACL